MTKKPIQSRLTRAGQKAIAPKSALSAGLDQTKAAKSAQTKTVQAALAVLGPSGRRYGRADEREEAMTEDDARKLRAGDRSPTTMFALGQIEFELGGRFATSSLDQSTLPQNNIWPEGLNNYPDQTGYEIDTQPVVGEAGEQAAAWALSVARERERLACASLEQLYTEYDYVAQLIGRQYRHDLAIRKEAIEAELSARGDGA